jgi:UDP-N-acetylmuramoyl-tripeptide--D-alanyl-D-alanine ligase
MHTSTETLYAHFLQHPQVCTDTRNIIAGGIFFALKGGNFNGNAFAAEALEKGAAYCVVDEANYATHSRCLLVDDVLIALQQLARHHRRQMPAKIFALTGSNGKTTTKELLARVLAQKFRTHATTGNLNNHIGVPLTLLALKPEHEIAVVEMGANHQQEIADLCAIAEPDYGLITNIGLAHLEGFGGPEGVLKGKTEMYDALRKRNGLVLVLADDARLIQRSEGMTRVFYGTTDAAELKGVLLDATPFVQFSWSWQNKQYNVDTKMVGTYNFPNMLAAATAGIVLGVTPEKISEALAAYVPANSRSQLIEKNGNTILLDAYNANPSSMTAAIINFSQMEAQHKFLILGDMFELGDQAAEEHQRVVDLLATQKLNSVILAGKNFAATTDSFGAIRVDDGAQAAAWLKDHPQTNTLMLIKGSRGMKLETVLEAI